MRGEELNGANPWNQVVCLRKEIGVACFLEGQTAICTELALKDEFWGCYQTLTPPNLTQIQMLVSVSALHSFEMCFLLE
jgi:hypothetical protein